MMRLRLDDDGDKVVVREEIGSSAAGRESLEVGDAVGVSGVGGGGGGSPVYHSGWEWLSWSVGEDTARWR